MCRYLILFLAVVTSFKALGQDCPLNPVDVCSGCTGNWPVPIFQHHYESDSGSTCSVTLSWNYPDNSSFVSPRMVFSCSYENGSYCELSDIEMCASCQSVTFASLDLTANPVVVYSDTCTHVDTIVLSDVCVSTTPSMTVQTTSPTTTPSIVKCTGAFEEIGGRCLFVDPVISVRWDEAVYFCQEFSGELVSIDNDDLFLGILEYLQTNNLVSSSYWLSGNDKLIEGSYVWRSGAEIELGTPYWATNGTVQEPSNVGTLNYDCIQMDAERFLYYDDDHCLNYKAVICEKFFV